MTDPWILAVDLGTGGGKTGRGSLRAEGLPPPKGHPNTPYLPDGCPGPEPPLGLAPRRVARLSIPGSHHTGRTLLSRLGRTGPEQRGGTHARRAATLLSWRWDNRPGDKPAYVPEPVRRSGRDAARLPQLLPTGSVLGDVQVEAGEELGIPSVPVGCGVPGLHTAFLGSGAVAPYEAHITLSTTSWLACRGPFKRTHVIHPLATRPDLPPR